MKLLKTSEESTSNGIFSCKYKSDKNINIMDFINTLQEAGYYIRNIGVGSDADMYERKLMPTYTLNDFTINYDAILKSDEYDGVEMVIRFNDSVVHLYIKGDQLKIVNYDTPIDIDDILKKKEINSFSK